MCMLKTRLKFYPEKNVVGNAGWSNILIEENSTRGDSLRQVALTEISKSSSVIAQSNILEVNKKYTH